jgi:ParB family chromosome partitioning protein
MPLLQLSPNEKVLDTYLKIADFDNDIKRYIADHEIPMMVIDLLANLLSNDRRAVFTLISTLKLGINKVKELLTYLEEIALRDNCSIHHVLEDSHIQEILNHKKYRGPQKAERIRQVIRKRRYPELTKLEQEYHEHLKRLHLSHGLYLETDRFFEDDNLSATFRFSTPEKLRKFAEELRELSQKVELRDVLDLIQGKR